MNNLQVNQTIIPYFMILNALKFIDFTQKVFNGGEVGTVEKLRDTEGVIHAEMKIGNSTIYFADTSADGSCGPGVCGELNTDGLIPIQMYIHVENVADTYKKAIAEGATPLMEPSEETGNMGGFVDPFENLWWIKSKK
ncbi:hypothetical protein AJ85_11690 [Alkalihalobacillus alcalophilus ATCC 27647 = CGMCC 1.3604]|uniref:VOC domain-containing protein n=1 Tax=Alkalihalobacillus alcalophilus ATCC 27647 = CGMCC 1.3604 TaxID=1218173 RepID=A0A4S4JYH5_ALKAL|nr:hypothetical protein [Alkalihalobacillus alcalophilus]MED1564196.1 hypothetical protein [Alkalihalobacillus alcalophilus]THG90261.1 hypothetical protein AJ85_11690 [Alkalihalobacillus alcalophilus ATCC 27647 = CGMCC 1.3604]